MTVKLIVFCIALTIIGKVCSADDPVTNEITITEIRIPKEGDTFTICTSGKPDADTYKSATLYAADIKEPEGKGQEESTTTIEDECFTFNVATLTFFEDPETRITIRAINNDSGKKDGLGSADLSLAADDVPTTITVAVFGPDENSKNIVRVADNLKNNVLQIGEEKFPCKISGQHTNPCYFMNIESTIDKYYVCNPNIRLTNTAGDPIPICTDVTQETQTTMESAIETVVLDNASQKVTFTKTVDEVATTTNVEIVIQKTGGQILSICPVILAGASCPLNEDVGTSAPYDVSIVYTLVEPLLHGTEETTTVLGFDKTTVIYRGLTGTSLTSTILEVTWTKDVDYYQLKRDKKADDDAFTTADVDCSLMTGQCSAYYTGLTPEGEYKLTLGVVTWGAPPLTPEPEQESTTATMIAAAGRRKIDGIVMLSDSSHADGVTQVCFRPSEISYSGSQFEAIIIDEDGHLIKLYNTSQVNERTQCFSPVNLLESSLSITKITKLTVVIVEREIDGVNVFASGNIEMDVPAMRVYKQEVDNGNQRSSSTLAIVGAAFVGIACFVALVAAAFMFVMKFKRENDGLQYPLQHSNLKDSSITHGLENPIPTM